VARDLHDLEAVEEERRCVCGDSAGNWNNLHRREI